MTDRPMMLIEEIREEVPNAPSLSPLVVKCSWFLPGRRYKMSAPFHLIMLDHGQRRLSLWAGELTSARLFGSRLFLISSCHCQTYPSFCQSLSSIDQAPKAMTKGKGKGKGKGGGCPSLHSPAELAFYAQSAVHNLLFFLAETLGLILVVWCNE